MKQPLKMKLFDYDYIIIGAGASGLMLADAIANDLYFKDNNVLLIDKSAKNVNDRTWSFWEKGTGDFDELVSCKWENILFKSSEYNNRFEIAPYAYKMVRGLDFYNHMFERLKPFSTIGFEVGEVLDVIDVGTHVEVLTETGTYTAKKVFNSKFDYKMATHQSKYPVLQQHFVGWVVKTKKPIFETDQATYMDFSVPQHGNTRFMYVLPYAENLALVEYTLFSKELLLKQEYEKALRSYLANDLGTTDYEIVETEQGSIPMTCYEFNEHHSENVRYIGTAGGWAKPSTGYTFMSSKRKIPKLIAHIKSGKPLNTLSYKNRFWFYDLLFLDVLYDDNKNGHLIFESIFEKSSPQLVFKFLDERTTILEDLKYILSAPWKPFIKALLKRVFKSGF